MVMTSLHLQKLVVKTIYTNPWHYTKVLWLKTFNLSICSFNDLIILILVQPKIFLKLWFNYLQNFLFLNKETFIHHFLKRQIGKKLWTFYGSKKFPFPELGKRNCCHFADCHFANGHFANNYFASSSFANCHFAYCHFFCSHSLDSLFY